MTRSISSLACASRTREARRRRNDLKSPNTHVGLTFRSVENACSFRGQGGPREEILQEDPGVRDVRALRNVVHALCSTSHISGGMGGALLTLGFVYSANGFAK